jgi:deoxyribonuclease-4
VATPADLDLGCHLTLTKGAPAAMDMARDLGATNLQVFTRNPRGGARRDLPDEEVEEGKVRRRERGIRTLIGHIPYTVNLASPRDSAYEFARMVIHADLRWAARLGVDVLVVHPGSHVDSGVDAGIKRIVIAIRQALEGYEGGTALLLEGMSGQGSEIGGTPEELACVIDGLGGDPRVGVCLDSCHLFAAGWDMTTPEGVDAAIKAHSSAVGVERIRCLHLNDSFSEMGSHRDRHARIGQGKLGEAGIRAVVTNPVLSRIPLCLETPVDDYPEYADEIMAVRRIIAAG